MPPRLPELYLNITVENKKDIVVRRVSERLGTGTVATGVVGKIANDLVSVAEVTKQVADGVVDQIPLELKPKGLIVKTAKRFQRGCLAVVVVQIVSVDFARLAEAGSITPAVLQLVQCFEFLPSSLHAWLYGNMLQRIALGMVQELPEKVREDLHEGGGVEASVTACRPIDEAAQLFTMLEEMEEQELAERKSIRKSVQQFTGHEEYRFGDITKAVVSKVRRGEVVGRGKRKRLNSQCSSSQSRSTDGILRCVSG